MLDFLVRLVVMGNLDQEEQLELQVELEPPEEQELLVLTDQLVFLV